MCMILSRGSKAQEGAKLAQEGAKLKLSRRAKAPNRTRRTIMIEAAMEALSRLIVAVYAVGSCSRMLCAEKIA